MTRHELTNYSQPHVHPHRYPKHKDPAKGQVYEGVCNRTACDSHGARWWNLGTYALYCEDCARAINEANRGKPPLVIFVPCKPALGIMEQLKRDHHYYEICS